MIYKASITFLKVAPAKTTIARLVTIDAAGIDRLRGEDTFHHTRSLPGSGRWEPV